MFLLLYALIAAVSQPAATDPDPHLLCIDVYVSSPTDPVFDCAAQASFHHPAFNPRMHGNAVVYLDGTLPGPFSVWQLAEVNPSPTPNRFQGYVVLRNKQSGSLAVLAIEDWDAASSPSRRAKQVVLRPSTRPAPPWPGIGCITVMPDQHPIKGNLSPFRASLVGGEYVAEDDLGWFHEGDLLPKPWDEWRLTEILLAKHPHGPGPFESGVMLRNEKTGQTVEVLQKRIDLPPRATTHPSDDLIAAATHPAGAK